MTEITSGQAFLLAQRIEKLETILGSQFVGKSSDELRAALTPASAIPGGRYPYILDSYQLHSALDDLYGGTLPAMAKLIADQAARIATLEARPASTVVTPPPVPVPSGSVDVAAALAALDIHVSQGKLAIGMLPDMDADAQIQVGGSGSAEILFRSNQKGLDAQNPGEVHSNVLSGAGNDGGMRLIQYGFWGRLGNKRNTLNRPMTIFALDSMGDICISDDRVARGQVFYFIKDFAAKAVRLCAFQVGWAINVRETPATYGDPSKVTAGTPQ